MQVHFLGLTPGGWLRMLEGIQTRPEGNWRGEAADMQGYFVDQAQGELADLGVATMRLIVSKAETNGAFAVAEFRGSEGRWTVPHVHRGLEESFYVLEGSFAFTLGERDLEAK